MGEGEMGSVVKETLKSLCCSNGWSYGVFWRFDQRNSMLLTMGDAYCEEQVGDVVNSMLLQVHMLGEGIIGQAAFTGKDQWMFSDDYNGGRNSLGSIGGEDIFQDDSELHHQFSVGIKTIAVISVESRGVVQFGSTQKILERREILDQTKSMFQEKENIDGLISQATPSSSFCTDNYDLNEWFTSLMSAGNLCNGNSTSVHGGSCNELLEKASSLVNVTQSSPFTSEVHHERVIPMHKDSAHPSNKLQTADAETHILLSSMPDSQFEPFLQSASSFNNSAAIAPCISSWSSDGSAFTSFELQLPSKSGVWDSMNMFSAEVNDIVLCEDVIQNFQGDSTFTSLYSRRGATDIEKSSQDNFMANLLPTRFPEEFKQSEFTTDFSSSCAVDDVSEWFASSPDHSINRMASTVNDNHAQSIGFTTLSSALIGGDVSIGNPVKHSANSVYSSAADTHVSDRQQKSIFVHGAENDLFDCLGLQFGCAQARDCLEDIMMPVVSGGHSAISTGVSDCISELDVGSAVGHRNGLFSELGLEELLNGVSNCNSVITSCFEDQLSNAKRGKMENLSVNSNQVQLASFPCPGGTAKMQPVYNLDKASNLVSKKDVFPKSQVGLWIDDSYSINAGSAVVAPPRKADEPAKATRKRARPGESARPRPKDRQQIQDRLRELRGIIPNGGKCSIDALLDHTIKHMLFLQSVTKYADKLKQASDPKLIGQEDGVVLKDSSTTGSGSCGGATWAFEVGGQAMVCPIIVKDLSPPGQMLIEVLCEDQGFFLEIADEIRGFGLNILKGVMEIREDKIWARFIVEAANRHITRIDIFWSLVQLLQQTATSGTDSSNQPCNIPDDSGVPPLKNHQQQQASLPLPISLAETLQ